MYPTNYMNPMNNQPMSPDYGYNRMQQVQQMQQAINPTVPNMFGQMNQMNNMNQQQQTPYISAIPVTCLDEAKAARISLDRFIKSSSITASSSDVIITISSAPTLTNLKRFCLVLAQNLPEGANTLPVQISIGGTTYPVYTRTGNLLRADQIRCRRVYPIIFGNDPNHFSLLCCVPNTVYTPPVVVPTEG